eukprot:CAMPEP_0178442000 /NCGR_PEP_ID=MMETSP0689_2-20121128/37880_1 /TAXON_ID=160604 /ORGANISM="Amphidinium massartii, Strain CS-259" /LENGTH=390 /DNA_ID=CAMNT_0020065415 /DNA_START=102 /DNA_END=1270 /DNA_ORIENTATION=+
MSQPEQPSPGVGDGEPVASQDAAVQVTPVTEEDGSRPRPVTLGVPSFVNADVVPDEVNDKICEKVLEVEEHKDVETQSVRSTSSELECPICYQTFCEPVRAGCNRHIFCRHCLWRMQRSTEPIKCPICRALGPYDATILAEVTELTSKLRTKDPTYDARAKSAKEERQTSLRQQQQERAQRVRQDEVRQFEVCGAGCEESNGVYVMDVMHTYCGPPTYRKPNTHFWIYRWNRTQWVIAELREQSRMGNERSWLYTAPTQLPQPSLPPAGGWEVSRRSRAVPPAPEVREVRISQMAMQVNMPSVVRSERPQAIIAPLQPSPNGGSPDMVGVPPSVPSIIPSSSGGGGAVQIPTATRAHPPPQAYGSSDTVPSSAHAAAVAAAAAEVDAAAP